MNEQYNVIKNSFLEEKLEHKTVLVIVPHEDDEINVAGNVILDFVNKGCSVCCAFSTNGDYSFFGKTRIREAVQSLHILGVERVFFLGYGDSPGYYKGGHVFYAEEHVVESRAGRKETYGTKTHPDFSWLRRKRHSAYCRDNFLADMKDLILHVKADIIFCVDCDSHTDHRACSMAFEIAMGEILRQKGNRYQPLVFKGFAYCTAFDASIDFYQQNLASTLKPDADDTRIIGMSCYDWNKRIRFPVVSVARAVYLRKNILYAALCAHQSQSIALRACRIINGDNVFWFRRTDSLSYQANIAASSGCAEKLNDFQFINFADICSRKFNFADYIWTPDKNDEKKTVIFSWKQTQSVSEIKLYGNLNEDSRILKFSVSFDTGYFQTFGPMPEKGNVLVIHFPSPQQMRKCTIQILEWRGDAYGLAECEFYASSQPKNDLLPFIKMKIEDNFVYDYVMEKKQKNCQIGVYFYPRSFPISFHILKGTHSSIDEMGNLVFSDCDDEILVRAEARHNSNIYDEILIRRVSSFYLFRRKVYQQLERIALTMYLKKVRKYVHIRQKYLKQL